MQAVRKTELVERLKARTGSNVEKPAGPQGYIALLKLGLNLREKLVGEKKSIVLSQTLGKL